MCFSSDFGGTLKKTACDGAQDAVGHDHKNGGGFAPLVGQRIDISVRQNELNDRRVAPAFP